MLSVLAFLLLTFHRVPLDYVFLLSFVILLILTYFCLDLSHALDASESGILMNRGTQVHNCCKEFHGSASCYYNSDKTPPGDISTHTVQEMFLSGSGCLDRHKDARSLNTWWSGSRWYDQCVFEELKVKFLRSIACLLPAFIEHHLLFTEKEQKEQEGSKNPQRSPC